MAMIPCPVCGEQISDKAIKCVHCGCVIKCIPKRKCVECGAELEDFDSVCRKCGCPVVESSNIETTKIPQQVELTKVSLKSNFNKKLIILIITLLKLPTPFIVCNP